MELGTRGLLVLFGALALVCGWFFAMGFTLGKHSVPASFTVASGLPPNNPVPVTPSPRASVPATIPTPPPAAAATAAPPNPGDLSAAESDQTPATLSSQTAAAAPPAPTPAASSEPAPPAAAPPTAVSGTPELVNTASGRASAAVPANGYSVQVFSGAKESDAMDLAAALKSRQYPVYVLRPLGSDTQYRVQVGPYNSIEEAESMRARLTADGYSAVIKQ